MAAEASVNAAPEMHVNRVSILGAVLGRASVAGKLIPLLVASLVVIGAGITLIMPKITTKAATDDAVEMAQKTAKQFTALRSYYTTNIVQKVTKNKDFKAGVEHGDGNVIPLPATMIHELSTILRGQGTEIELFSPYPFPNRKDRQLDPFQKEAWAFLSQHNDQPFVRTETINGKPVVRVGVADRMTSEACVNCHNTTAGSPKTDWKVDDLRGVLEVDADISAQIGRGEHMAWLIACGIAGALGLAIVAVYLRFRAGIVRPVKAMTATMTRLAQGERDVVVPETGRGDEIGAMAGAVKVFKEAMSEAEEARRHQEETKRTAEAERKAMLDRMAATFEATIKDVVERVSASSAELRSAAQAMSATAGQMDARATAVAGATEEASTNVQTVAAATEELSASVGEISRQATDSTRICQRAVAEATQTHELVYGLADAARKIGDVVTLINDIASQTNLLALNATIEAARAGEAGKGFAVVASEVKALATQTAKATDEIRQQVTAVQTTSEGSVSAIKSIAGTIEHVNEIAASIHAAVEQQGAAIAEIARNGEQAALGTSEVSANIAGVSQSASETGAAASQVLGAASELQRQSQTLRDEVTRFLATMQAA